MRDFLLLASGASFAVITLNALIFGIDYKLAISFIFTSLAVFICMAGKNGS